MERIRCLVVGTVVAIFFIGCGAASTHTTGANCDETQTVEAETGGDAPDAVSGASMNHFSKPKHWTDKNLIEILKNPKAWKEDAFWAMATVDAQGRPNIASFVPLALRDDILIIANKASATKTNMSATRFAHAIFRALKPESSEIKHLDPYGVVGSRLTLEIVDDPKEVETLWKEYEAAGKPVSPPPYTAEDHIFMRIVEITPLG